MLSRRILTAFVLLALLLPALFAASAWPFALLTLLLVGAAAWEWARLNGLGAGASLFSGALLGGLGVAVLALDVAVPPLPAVLWWAALAAWVTGGPLALRGGVAGWPRLPRAVRWSIGMLMLALAWLALASAWALGIHFLLSVFALVWVADIAAYFGGRAFGRRKLAPSISPGKSWEGVYCGVAGVLSMALLWVIAESHLGAATPSLYRHLDERLGSAGLAVALVFLSGMSVVGDLFESLVKRSAGAKDSSALLPGHGGVLDRIDALLPVFPLAIALSSL